jgi:uncharacterized protein (TIGR03435 family)
VAPLVAAPQPKPEFDAATLKRSPPPPGDLIYINLGTALNGKVTLTNTTLSDCIKFAYGLSADAQLSGPDWMSRDFRYDIVAQAPPETPRAQLLVMLQALLADRLKLVLHREPRELRYLALIPVKTGTKLRLANPEARPNGPALAGLINSPQMLMTALAKLLSRFEHETVLDMTGLDGLYEVHLEWTPDEAGNQNPDRSNGPSLATALQEQLGLRLESRKGPVEILVVDSAEKVPSEN